MNKLEKTTKSLKKIGLSRESSYDLELSSRKCKRLVEYIEKLEKRAYREEMILEDYQKKEIKKPEITDEKYKFPHCENDEEKQLFYIDDLEEYCDKLQEKLQNYRIKYHCLNLTIIDLCRRLNVENEDELRNIYLKGG